MKAILKNLAGDDFRSIGKSNEIVKSTLVNPDFFPDIFTGLLHNDPLIRMRAADAIEKITKIHPEWLQPYKRTLLKKILPLEQQEVRWHVAQMIPRLKMTKRERNGTAQTLFTWLNNKKESKIVRVMALQALSDFARLDNQLKNKVIKTLHKLLNTGAPSLKSRGKKLLKEFSAKE
ncbi:hypothetical protein L6252_01225 [Candidatus Parcubacteria bacterium]|nr:hypothetical protein [Candidatus Parcubacteria bacterium]